MKFYIKSLGCKTNQIEGQIIAQSLLKAGFEQTDNKTMADIYILNSCAVTSHSNNQGLYLIKQIKKAVCGIKVILTGCSAQTADEKEFEGVDLILGNSEKQNIEKYIKVLFQNDKKKFVGDIFKQKKFEGKLLYNSMSTRPCVKIQDGCNNTCAYCIIPYARGNSRSQNIENIIKQIELHIQNNKKEIVLTGIHIGQWGLDFNKKLIDLLQEIEKTKILRYRLGSLYINEIDDELFDFLKNSKKFCPHFHLSLQSLCDKTLFNMNRNYTKQQAMDFIAKVKSNFDIPYIGCDIITGFPRESAYDFIETKKALLDARISYIHSFPYSKRKGTKGYTMKGQVLEHVKKERTKELIELCGKLHREFLNANKNKIRTILYERGKNGIYQGVSENYIKVYKKSDVNLQNCIETCNLNEFDELH